MKSGDWVTLAVLVAVVLLVLLGRHRGRQAAATAQAAAYAHGQSDLKAELAAISSATATGGAVAVHMGEQLSERERLILAAYRATDDDRTTGHDNYLAAGRGPSHVLPGHPSRAGDEPYRWAALLDTTRCVEHSSDVLNGRVAAGDAGNRDFPARRAAPSELTEP